MKRVFLIVLDSVGIGEMPDAADYGDAGSNTIRAVASSPYFSRSGDRRKRKESGRIFRENDGGIERKRYDDRALGDCGHHLKQSAADLPGWISTGNFRRVYEENRKRSALQ